MTRLIRWLIRLPVDPPPPAGTAATIQDREQQAARQRLLAQARMLRNAGYRYDGVIR